MTTEPVTVSAVAEEETFAVRVPGRATGPLLGGNLCLVVASLGTPDMPDLTGALLLVEDVQEPPYKVDRMLTQLRRAGVLDGLAGVAVGQFTDCADGWSVGVADVLSERLGDLGVPVLGGLPIGHGPGQLTVPVGTEATLDAETGTLTVTPPSADPTHPPHPAPRAPRPTPDARRVDHEVITARRPYCRN